MSDPASAQTPDQEGVLKLSHSAMEAFAECPRSFDLGYLHPVPQVPNVYAVLGGAVHTAIERDLSGLMAGYNPMPEHSLLQVLTWAIEDRLAKEDPDGTFSLKDQLYIRQRGYAAILAYVNHVQRYAHPIAVERYLSVQHPDDLSVRFVGMIDAILERPIHPQDPDSPTIRVMVDWKIMTKPMKLGEEHERPQATAYSFLLQESDLPAVDRITFMTIIPDREAEAIREDEEQIIPAVVEPRMTQRTAAEVMMYRARILQTAARIRGYQAAGEFPATPHRYCPWRGCLAYCPEGRAHIRAKGWKPAVPLEPVARATPKGA